MADNRKDENEDLEFEIRQLKAELATARKENARLQGKVRELTEALEAAQRQGGRSDLKG